MIGLGQALRRARRPLRVLRDLESIRINQGTMLAGLNRASPPLTFNGHEFKVFSQWGEDGLIQYLTQALDLPSRTFIEFGVEDFSESNCRFLMMKDNWRGFVIDGSPEFSRDIRESYYFWRHQLQVETAFVDRDNVSGLLARSGFGQEPSILSIDIDGVDWWVLNALGEYRAPIVIVEYNSLFGAEAAVTVPYDPTFVRGRAHPSNIYYGASVAAFAHLLDQRGYAPVGGNLAGSNAFFVRRDLLNERVREVSLAEVWRPASFREARGAGGRLCFASPREARAMIANMPLIDVTDGRKLTVIDLPDFPPNRPAA